MLHMDISAVKDFAAAHMSCDTRPYCKYLNISMVETKYCYLQWWYSNADVHRLKEDTLI